MIKIKKYSIFQIHDPYECREKDVDLLRNKGCEGDFIIYAKQDDESCPFRIAFVGQKRIQKVKISRSDRGYSLEKSNKWYLTIKELVEKEKDNNEVE